MEEKIGIIHNGLRCEVGRIKVSELADSDGLYINIMTHFEPLSVPTFLLELRTSPSVEYLSNIAFYGQLGGIGVKLKHGVTHEQIVRDIKRSFEALEGSKPLHF